jgi:hypothetical protein
MIGDVNLFMTDGPQGEDVECEIMIAGESDWEKEIGYSAIVFYRACNILSIPFFRTIL